MEPWFRCIAQGLRRSWMNTVTVANGDILAAKGVGNNSFKTEHGELTFTGVLHVPGEPRSPKYAEDAKNSTELFLWHKRFIAVENWIDDHSGLLLRKLDRCVKRFTWISKAWWIWIPSENTLLSDISQRLFVLIWAQHSRCTFVPKVRFCKTLRTVLLNWTEPWKGISALSWIWCAVCLKVLDCSRIYELKL